MECKLRLLCTLVAALASSGMASAQEELNLYVGYWGNDNRTWQQNSAQAPFATVMRARDSIREYRAQTNAQDLPITVFIAGAEYTLTQPLLFESQDSGWPNFPIRYIAWDPNPASETQYEDDVLFSGGYRVTG